LTSTSCKQIAEDVFANCLAGDPPKKLPRCLLEEPCARNLFGVLVEGLADRFDPVLVDLYAQLFADAIASLETRWNMVSLLTRYERVRRPRPVSGKPHRVVVLSRITLGADVAVTSVLIAAAKRRFPHAEIIFAGPRKNYELFSADPHIHHALLEYPRGSLGERLVAGGQLQAIVGESGEPSTIVIDPDSRLTQLGILPVCNEENYFFFESRAYGAATDWSLPELAAQWASEILGAAGAKPFLALGRKPRKSAGVSVSLGVGENRAKRIPDPIEAELLKLLAETGMPLTIDMGAGGEEKERVMRAIESSGVPALTWEGSFAGFARIIAASRLYVGYDSAGQHVAAACGVPLISIFAGFPSPRFFARWRPQSEGSQVIRLDRPDPEEVLARVRSALSETAAEAGG
jgi:ADP-heptose:LPS heptosyltransferase